MCILNVGRQRLFRASLITFAVMALALSVSDRSASGHAALDRSDPPANAVLAASPTQISMWFTEPLERSYSEAALYDQNGQPVSGATSRAGDTDKSMVIDLANPLPNGTYSVVWQTLSNADGHSAEAYFAFTVGSQADVTTVAPPATTSEGGPPLWLRSLSRWAALIGLALAVAIWPVWLLVLRPAISPAWQAGPTLTRRIKRFTCYALALALIGNLFALLVQAATLPTGSYSTRLWDTVSDTRYGRLWGLRLLLLGIYGILLTVVPWWWPQRRRWRSAAALIVAVSLPIPISLNAHASALTTGRTAAIAIDVFHLLAATVWIGGLFLLLGGLLPIMRSLTPSGRQVVIAKALRRFSALALVSWVALGLTGLYSAWLQVGNLDGLRDTAYGRSLTVKLLLLLPLLVLAAFNLLIVSRRLRKPKIASVTASWIKRLGIVVGVEVILVVLVLFFVGRLTSQQPARDVLVSRAEQTTLDLALNDRTGTLALAPASVGPNHYVLNVNGETLPEGTEAVLRLTLAGQSIGQKEVKLERAVGNRFETHGSELSIAGDWTIQVIVRQIGAFQYTGSQQLAIGTSPPDAHLPQAAWRFSTGGLAGVLLIMAGIAAMGLAWYAGRSPLRKESAGLGIVSLALGALILIQGRVEPVSATIDLSVMNPVVADAGSVSRGEQTFLTSCAACHGPAGNGDGPSAAGFNPPPADFTTGHSRTHLEAEFYAWVKNGKPGTGMPAFGGNLSDEEIWDVINYVRTQFQGFSIADATPTPP